MTVREMRDGRRGVVAVAASGPHAPPLMLNGAHVAIANKILKRFSTINW